MTHSALFEAGDGASEGWGGTDVEDVSSAGGGGMATM